jgi:hypothetical protein
LFHALYLEMVGGERRANGLKAMSFENIGNLKLG